MKTMLECSQCTLLNVVCLNVLLFLVGLFPATFSSDSRCAALHELNVYTVEDKKLIARNTQVHSVLYMYILIVAHTGS